MQPTLIPSISLPTTSTTRLHDLTQNIDEDAAASNTVVPHVDDNNTNNTQQRIMPSYSTPSLSMTPSHDLDLNFDDDMQSSPIPAAAASTTIPPHVDVTNNVQDGNDCLPLAAAYNFDSEAQCEQAEFDGICANMLDSTTFDHIADLPEDITQDITQDDVPVASTTTSVKAIVRQIRQGIRYVVSWDRMLSYLSLHGRVTFTKYHYAVMAAAVNTASDGTNSLSHWNRVKDAQATFIRSYCLPRNNLHYVQSSKAQTRTNTQVTAKAIDGTYQDVRDCIRVVLPSEWAKLDVITYPLFDQLYGSDSMDDDDAMTIEHSILRLPSLRRTAFGGRLSLWVLHKHGMVPSSLHDRIKFPLTTITNGASFDCNLLRPWLHNSHQEDQDSATHHHIWGKVGPMWCAGNGGSNIDTCTSHISDMFDHEKRVFNALSTATRSLSDLGLGSSGGRHGTQASSSMQSVQIYPADFCAFIRPSNIHTDMICLLICSFLGRGANLPAERLLWITVDSISSAHELVVLDPPILLERTSSFGGRHGDKQVTNQGSLQDGRPYYIYRFLLYQDGFGQKNHWEILDR